jgi:hypothetical protein
MWLSSPDREPGKITKRITDYFEETSEIDLGIS